MKYMIAFLTLILAAISSAETVQQKVDALNAKTETVLSAWLEVAPVTMERSPLYRGTIAWVEIAADETVQRKSQEIIVRDLGVVGQETAYWMGQLPAPLKPETKYLTGRTTAGWGNLSATAQATAIENFCNSVYVGANAGAGNIREFSTTPVNGSTIRVSGYFDLGTTWQRQEWYVRLIDPNGSVASPYSNIEFQKVVE